MNPSLQRVDLVIPVHDEERALRPNLELLLEYLRTDFPFAVRVVIADNASTDGTLELARRLAYELPDVRVLHLPAKGRGRALRAAWSATDAYGRLQSSYSLHLARVGARPRVTVQMALARSCFPDKNRFFQNGIVQHQPLATVKSGHLSGFSNFKLCNMNANKRVRTTTNTRP